MCGSGQRRAAPADMAEALAMAGAAADYLNAADLAALPAQAQGEALLALERLDGKLTAAHAKLTAVFAAANGPQADGSYSAKTWLRHHGRLTGGAAGARVAWARRLSFHPQVAAALADGDLSPSWAGHLCDWTSRLPAEHQQTADEILVAAAGRGADLDDLAVAADEIRRRTCPVDPDEKAVRVLGDRNVYLGRTFGGAGRLEGDLTPAAAAAVSAVLEALGGRAGPEDHRSLGQRNHDALAEGCRRLVAAGNLPDRAGQDTRAEVAIPLGTLHQLPGAADAENAWIRAITGAAATADGTALANSTGSNRGDGSDFGDVGDLAVPAHPRLAGAEAAATACDTTVVPMVTGHLNQAALDQLTDCYLAARAGLLNPGTGPLPSRAGISGQPDFGALPEGTRQRLQATLLRWAIEALSGPGGLASHLRTSLLGMPDTPGGDNRPNGHGGPLATRSLPLDIGQASDTIPAHLRRAVIARDQRCAFPGCQQPPGTCQVHHITPRSRGGSTALHNMILLCSFHHLTVVHDWGWAITLHPDGTTTATSPHGRALHSHDPPRRTA